MTEPTGPPRSDPVANAAAAVSLVLGVALLTAPSGVARVLGVAPERGMLRAIGGVDLALAPGLALARPQWPWLMARAASNPVIALVTIVNARSVRARILAAALFGVTALDLSAAMRLRADAR